MNKIKTRFLHRSVLRWEHNPSIFVIWVLLSAKEKYFVFLNPAWVNFDHPFMNALNISWQQKHLVLSDLVHNWDNSGYHTFKNGSSCCTISWDIQMAVYLDQALKTEDHQEAAWRWKTLTQHYQCRSLTWSVKSCAIALNVTRGFCNLCMKH